MLEFYKSNFLPNYLSILEGERTSKTSVWLFQEFCYSSDKILAKKIQDHVGNVKCIADLLSLGVALN